MKRIIALLLVCSGMALPYLKSLEVLPTRADWSGWTHKEEPNNWVGNTFIANFDSIAEVQVFIGYVGDTSHHYDVEVKDNSAGDLVAYRYNVPAHTSQGHVWLHFPMTPDGAGKFTRGKEYVLRVTRPGDSINWYDDITNKYQYGQMVGGTGLHPPPQSGSDLCARIYGLARVGDEFSVQSVVAWGNGQGSPRDTAGWADLVESEVALGVKSDKLGYSFGPWLNPASGEYHWAMMDSLVTHFAAAGIKTPVHVGPGTWASSGSHKEAIARGLFEPLRDSTGKINDSNLVGRFIYDFAKRYGPHGEFWQSHQGLNYLPIDLYETPPEPTTHYAFGNNGDSNGYWEQSKLTYTPYKDTLQHHIHLHNDSPDSVYLGRKSSFMHVYARYVIVQDSALKLAAQSLFVPAESVPRNAAYCITMAPWNSGQDSGTEEHFYPGEWLDGYRQYGVGPFFDVASYHPYGKSVADQEALLRDTFRYYFRSGGWFSPRPFWVSEAGYFCYTPAPNECDTSWPLKVTETYATMQAVNTVPAYSVEQWTWFTYTQRYLGDYCDSTYDSISHTWVKTWVKQSITDSEFMPRTAGYAYKQWSELCKGASFEGRLHALGGDNPAETLWIHVFQYRDSIGKRFWIAWEDLHWPHVYGARILKVPARSDTESVCGVDYDGSPPSNDSAAEPTGWFAKQFDTFPVIITEHGTLHRPDITVDSVWCTPDPRQGGPVVFHAKLRNHGTDSTPVATPAHYMCTRVKFYIEGELVRQKDYLPSIHIGENDTVTVSADTAIALPVPLPLLVCATTNEEQMYVELGMDDNTGYFKCGTSP